MPLLVHFFYEYHVRQLVMVHHLPDEFSHDQLIIFFDDSFLMLQDETLFLLFYWAIGWVDIKSVHH